MAEQDERDQGTEIGASFHVHGEHSTIDARFIRALSGRDLRFSRFVQRPARLEQRDEMDAIGVVIEARSTPALEERILELAPDALAHVTLRDGHVTVFLTAANPELANQQFARLTALFEPPEDDPSEVPVTFWSWTDDGGDSAHRRIRCDSWDGMAVGYCAEAGACMARLTAATEPGSGRLILWHGPPGTGKTHAVRGLVRAWREWCVPHLVTDPEKFLGDSTYAMNVLTSGDPEPRSPREWHLVVLEDSGELLRADAHERTGQALSRLLNLTDGLLGQGMNALALITTNEPVGRLHPAITRPGRCWDEVEFGPLGKAEANRWLKARESNCRVAEPTTLAGLYAILNGHAEADAAAERRPHFGFAAA